jgi:guanylate cyclase
MNNQPLTFFEKLSRIGADPEDEDDIRIHKSLLVISSFFFMVLAWFWGILYFIFGEGIAGAIPFSYAWISLASLLHFRATRKYHFFRFSQLTLILVLPFLLMVALGGFINGSAVIVWAIVAPLGALLFDKPKNGVRWFIAFLALIVISGFLQPHMRLTNNLSAEIQTLFFTMNLAGTSFLVFILTIYFVTQKNVFQKRSEDLLLNILPKEIAKILKHEERTIADEYEEASVLFADMVGFTPLSARLDPIEMVDLLNEIFSHFDSLLDKHGVEKIRTIGDNYMVASGIPNIRPDHAQALVSMALDMREYIGTHSFLNDQQVNFRFGINSGSLIAGVIGRKKFVYDVWGDAVNVASRMESHGVRDSIQITQSTYELIKDDFDCEPRGTVNVKGKGEMPVWFVIGKKR